MELLADGDVFCYMAVDMNSHARYCDDDGIEVEFRPDPLVLQKSRKALNKHLRDVQDELYANKPRVAVKGTGNFRYDIYPKYKSGRNVAPTLLPKYADILRQEWIASGVAVPAHMMEADDKLGIWTTICEENKWDYAIATIDKDLDQLPGWHYHLKNNTLRMVTVEEARYQRFYQLCVGDSTDCIPGARLWGDVKVRKAFEGLNTEEEFQEASVDIYMKAHKDDWLAQLTLMGRLTHIMRRPDDIFSPNEWDVVKEILG